MLTKRVYYWMALLVVLTLNACSDNDLGSVEVASVLRFEFPQGNKAWDQEFEQIAKDWGMYIIYKDIDSLALNRSWTTPVNSSMAYKGDPVPEEYIPVYLDVIKTNMLGLMDKTNESNKKKLPVYLFLLNNFRNPMGQTMQINIDGFDYWVLSFTDEELVSGLSPQAKHKIACTFGYLPIASELDEGILKAPDKFVEMTDYVSPVGILNTGDIFMDSRDPVNLYLRRGFLPQISENFELVSTPTFPVSYAPSWMPWITGWTIDDSPLNRNPMYEQDVNARKVQDFINYIRYAMMYTEEQIKTMYPLDATDPLEQKGNALIREKYEIVINYMKSKGHNLQEFAKILTEKTD